MEQTKENKKALPQTAEPPALLKGSHEGCHVCRPIRMNGRNGELFCE